MSPCNGSLAPRLLVIISLINEDFHAQMLDLYELIGIPETASEVWIERSYQSARSQTESDEKLNKKQRAAALASLDEAYRTLSDPLARQTYDQQLESWREKKARGGPMVLVRQIVIGILTLGVIGGAAYWYQARQEEQVRLQAERIQSDLADKKRLSEIEEQRRASGELLQRAAIERKQEEETRLELAREQRAQDALTQSFVVDERYEKAQRDRKTEADRQQRANDDLKERFESERNRRQAQVELDRQRRFVEQREREEASGAQQREIAERIRLLQEQNKNR